MMDFQTMFATVDMGSQIRVSDGSAEPSGGNLWHAWHSHNHEGELVEKIDGTVREIVVQLPEENGCQMAFTINETQNHTFEIVLDELGEAKSRKWKAVKALRNRTIEGGCETVLGRMDSDEESRARIVSAMVNAQIDATFRVNWTMADNSQVPHSASAIIAAGLAINRFITTQHANAAVLRAAINACKTVKEVEAIVTPK